MPTLPPIDLSGYRFGNANLKAIADSQLSANQKRKDFAAQVVREREAAIKRWYSPTGGGYWFIAWVKKHYRRWSGEPLHWREPWQEEYYLLLGTPWFERLIVEKGSQVGFSESLIAINAFALACVRIPTGFGFEAERKLRDMVPRIQTSFDHIEPIQASRIARRETTGRKDVDYKERKITVAAVECTFFYTSTSSKQKGQERQASSAMSSFTAWLMCGDEIELWSEGSLDVATERQSACEMPTKPFRAGSTPGHEGGIVDAQLKSSGHLFQWHVTCAHCQAEQFLEPFGNLLKAVMQESDSGTMEERFIDVTGRPLDWFYHDGSTRNTKIETAYVGCSHCHQPLEWEALAAGHFACRNTGVRLRDLCDRAIREQIPIFQASAIRLPRLASTLFSAPERIRKLLETRNPADQIQQGLGIACSIGGGKISLPRILQCVGLPLPSHCTKPDLIVLGVDQGSANNLGMLQHWYLDDHADPEQRWLNAHVEVKWWGDIIGFEGIDRLAEAHNVDLVGLDGEPEKQMAAAYARKHPAGYPELKPKAAAYSTSSDGSYEIRLYNPLLQTQFQEHLAVSRWSILSMQYLPNCFSYKVKPYASTATSIVKLDAELNGSFSSSFLKSADEPIVEQFPKNHKVFLFDQVSLKGEDFRRAEREIQKQKVPVFALHRTAALDWVRDRIYRGQHHLPEGTTYRPGDETNLLVHYMSSDRQNNGIWMQTPGIPDHLLHCASFCEAVVLVSLYEEKPNTFVFGTIN